MTPPMTCTLVGHRGEQPSSHDLVERVALEVAGTPVEWVEACFATIGQPTIIYMARSQGHSAFADALAVSTWARVLCIDLSARLRGRPVEQCLRVYAWLLDEGVDLDTTAFVADRRDDSFILAVMQAAKHRRLPMPAAGVCIPSAPGLPKGRNTVGTPRFGHLPPLLIEEDRDVDRVATWLRHQLTS